MKTFSQGLIFLPDQANHAVCSLKNERLIKVITNFPASLVRSPGACHGQTSTCAAFYCPSLVACREKSVYRELLSKAATMDLALTVSLMWCFLKLEPVLMERDITQALATELWVAVRPTHVSLTFYHQAKALLAKARRNFFLCLRLITLATTQQNRKLGFWPSLKEQRIRIDIVLSFNFLFLVAVSHGLEKLLLQNICYIASSTCWNWTIC